MITKNNLFCEWYWQLYRKTANKWFPINTAPKNRPVLVHYKNTHGVDKVIKAKYIPKLTEEFYGDEYEDNDYFDEDRGVWYLPEGWYEMIDNSDEFCYWVLDRHHKPDFWMNLPKPPLSTIL